MIKADCVLATRAFLAAAVKAFARDRLGRHPDAVALPAAKTAHVDGGLASDLRAAGYSLARCRAESGRVG